MLKKKTRKFGTMLVMALMLTFVLSNVVYAAVIQNGTDVKFTKHFIDSNKYTTVATGSKVNAGKTLHVTVTHIYDDEGTEKDFWSKTRWKVYDDAGGVFSDEHILEKGQYTGITLEEKVTSSDEIKVKAKGNTSSLDAKISGYIHYFTKS